MTSQGLGQPFLTHFAELRAAEQSDAVGTSTATKAGREGGDTDFAQPSGDDAGHELGSQSLTNGCDVTPREEPDAASTSTASQVGTKTATATREEADSDTPSRSLDLLTAAQLGTKTGTRSPENGDADAAASRDPLWVGSIL
jgi:hypothetical protein